jgi:hypothetical protein
VASLRSVGRGQTQLELANPNHVTERQLLAATHLGFSVDPYLLGSKKRLCLSAAVDQPGQLEQLTEGDRRAFDSHVPKRVRLPR